MIKSDEQFFSAIERRQAQELTQTERQELNMLLESDLMQKAFKLCLESVSGSMEGFLQFDLSTEKGRMDATKLQGLKRGQMAFIGLLVDLSLDKENQGDRK